MASTNTVSKEIEQLDRQTKRYFTITLLIRHPDIDPDVITRQLRLQPFRCWKKGEQRKTPKGTNMDGIWEDSRWIHVFRFHDDEDVLEETRRILTNLLREKEFFKRMAAEGDLLELIIRLPGLVHNGFSLPQDLLELLTEMKMTLGIEVFPDWENDGLSD